MEFETVLARLSRYSESQPSKRVWSFLNDDIEICDSYTYKELENATNELAFKLINTYHLKTGDRALLVFFPGLAFTASLIACFKAGLIAVPVFPPDPRKLKKDLDHFISIQKSSDAKFVLTHSLYNYAKKITAFTNLFSSKKSEVSWPQLTWISVDDILSKGKSKSSSFQYVSNEIAFLQYTSGSTSEPKGVMISHLNLAHNLTIITRELKVDETTINVSWLPQYHDMGLIGSYLGALYCGGVGFYISPISFLKDPNIWIKSLSKYQASHTQAPNFAFALSVRKFKESYKDASKFPSLDLTKVKHMLNAAEPVDVDAINSFYDLFSQFGLSPDVVVPTYGLAEHTVFVCSDGKTVLTLDRASLENGRFDILSQELLSYEKSRHRKVDNNLQGRVQSLVGCGFYLKGEKVLVKIVDPESCEESNDGCVGEIWVDSPSKALGYWNQPTLSQESFHAQIVKKEEGGNEEKQEVGEARDFLRTGDMGFLFQGELFVCGRIKDVIIVRGANHYPQDLERAAERACSLLRPGCSAAFALTDARVHTEGVCLVAEVKAEVREGDPTLEQAVNEIRTCLVSEHGLALSYVCLIRARTVIKTTSGKISRSGCKKAFLADKLDILFKWEGRTDVENVVVDDDDEDAIDDPSEIVGEEGIEMQGVTKKKINAQELRGLSAEEIREKLVRALVSVSAQSVAPLKLPLDSETSLTALGLDSLSLVQVKGLLEKKFFCNVPDEFLFTSGATITELVKSIQHGGLTNEQEQHLAGNPITGNAQGEGSSTDAKKPGRRAQVIEPKSAPCCPWFTCCY